LTSNAGPRRQFESTIPAALGRLLVHPLPSGPELGADPDLAIEPYDPSPLGKAGHSVGAALGAAGEWVDQQAAKRGWDG